MKIGFLGLGNMGTPMALRLLAAGHELSVWNRSEERTKPLIHEGAIAAATPAEAELGSDAVITMLLDDAAYEEVLFGVHRLIDALSPGVLHILCGTISVALSQAADRGARKPGHRFCRSAGVWPPTRCRGRSAMDRGGRRRRCRKACPSTARGIFARDNGSRQRAVAGVCDQARRNLLTAAMIHSFREATVFAAHQGSSPKTTV